ncbi:uncharacterized protein LOC100197788 [Hydra vulgaris]|uniref:Uncharacterized protein LOC100197788 n=1 Tax=Hydra vulgaris TaxID=6087 RepID=A0ABM4DK53_HYDVU
MENHFDLYSEAATFLESIALTVFEQRNNCSKINCIDKLQLGWLKLQQIIEKDDELNINSFMKASLIEAQNMLRYLSEKSNDSTKPKNSVNENPLSESNSTDAQRDSVIESTIFKQGTITFDDIAGLDEAKTLLKEAVVLPLQYPHLFTGKRKPWRSILLYGPPGTGKSRMAQAVSCEIECTFYSVTSSDLLSSWFGESEKLIKELFTHARTRSTRSVIFIDEIDSLCRKRDSKEAETTRRVKTELLKQIEGANRVSEADIFFLCATNCPWELDTAFLRRFEKRIFIALPDIESRRQLFKIHLGDSCVNLKAEEWQRLLDLTEGYSGSDLATCIADALLEPIRDLQETVLWKWSDDKTFLRPAEENELGAVNLHLKNLPKEKVQPRSVTYQDIRKSLKLNQRTISCEELQRYEVFTKSFGQMG